jgi:hypothetical protein
LARATTFDLDRTRKYGMKYLPAVPVKKHKYGTGDFIPLNEIKPLEIGNFGRSAVGKDVLFSLSLARASRTNRRRSVGPGIDL